MEYQATAKYIRISTRKVRLVADSIRSLKPQQALVALEMTRKSASKPIAQVIESALANAKQANGDVDALHFKQIEVMGGPVMKRWHAVSKGQAHGYKKRMTHVRVVLYTKTDSTTQSKEEAK